MSHSVESLKKRSTPGSPSDSDGGSGTGLDSPGGNGSPQPKKTNPDVLLKDQKEWLLVQSRYLKLWKRRYVFVEREKITAHDFENDLSKPAYTIACQEILEVAPTKEDPLVVVMKLRGDVYYRFKFAIAERAQDWVAAVGMRSLKKSK